MSHPYDLLYGPPPEMGKDKALFEKANAEKRETMKVTLVIVEEIPEEGCRDCVFWRKSGYCIAAGRPVKLDEITPPAWDTQPNRPSWCPITTLKDLIYELGWEGDD